MSPHQQQYYQHVLATLNQVFLTQSAEVEQAATLFAEMKLPITDINAENAAMHAGQASEADINRHVDGWIHAHQQQFDRWIQDALAAAK